jgi:uncharacterized metal-binding protein
MARSAPVMPALFACVSISEVTRTSVKMPVARSRSRPATAVASATA